MYVVTLEVSIALSRTVLASWKQLLLDKERGQMRRSVCTLQ